MFKNLLITLLILVPVIAVASGWGWKVIAKSPSARGYGVHYNYYKAERRALSECADRTPAWQTCYVVDYYEYWINR